MRSAAAWIGLVMLGCGVAGCPMKPGPDGDPNDAGAVDGVDDDGDIGPPGGGPGGIDGDEGPDGDDGGQGADDDDLVGPPAPGEPNDVVPEPNEPAAGVRVDFLVTFADTGAAVDNALITVRTLTPLAVVCQTFTSFQGLAICEGLIPGVDYSVTVEATDASGTPLVTTEQFVPQAGLAVPETVDVLLFR